MVKPIRQAERVLSKVSVHIHGFQQCCSAAILHGVNGYTTGTRKLLDTETVRTQIRRVNPKPVRSLMEWQENYASKVPTVFGMNVDTAYAAILEKIWLKAAMGEGGTNMYASSSYCTKTWFIADRRRSPDSVSCLNFMLWLKKQGVTEVGRIHISPWRDGAHGGECKGGVYSPNLEAVRELLDDYIDMLNKYRLEVFKHYKLDMKTMGRNAPAADAVGELW